MTSRASRPRPSSTRPPRLASARRRSARPTALAALAALLATAPAAAQQPKAPPAYPEKDILTPFRSCTEISAPPEAQFEQLRVMMKLANDPMAVRSFDAAGVEVVDDPQWREARRALASLGLDAGHLAVLMRSSRDADHRALAFYGMFLCQDPSHVFNLIAHIPGEPVRRTREQAYPRAIAYMQAHIGTTYGDLSPEQQAALDLPEPGSPRARQLGITRAPRDGDLLFAINLKPYFQLLDLDEPLDQAQALWFLKECFRQREDLALRWLEPALPRVQQLLIADDQRVREQAIGLFLAIGPEDLEPPADDASPADLVDFAQLASKSMFPPIRRVNESQLLLFPSPERTALIAAGARALRAGIGETTFGKMKDGSPFRGFRIDRVPEDLEVLGIPTGAIITAVNGVPIRSADQLLQVIDELFMRRDPADETRMRRVSSGQLLVEFVHDGGLKAVEFLVE